MSSNAVPVVGSQGSGALGKKFGNDIYEVTRRRFANQGVGQSRQLASQFASRGGQASSAAAGAQRGLLNQQNFNLGQASLQSQTEGARFGQAEQGMLNQVDQFGRNLSQQGDLTREGFQNQRWLQDRMGQQQMEQLMYRQRYLREREKRGFLGSALGGIGSIFGSMILPGIGTAIGGGLGTALGGNTDNG